MLVSVWKHWPQICSPLWRPGMAAYKQSRRDTCRGQMSFLLPGSLTAAYLRPSSRPLRNNFCFSGIGEKDQGRPSSTSILHGHAFAMCTASPSAHNQESDHFFFRWWICIHSIYRGCSLPSTLSSMWLISGACVCLDYPGFLVATQTWRQET